MRIGLFVPCFVDQFFPQVAFATLRLLERFAPSATVEFPPEQTCCGQPMANTGCTAEARPLAERFLKLFGDYDYVVAPSGSCVAMVRLHYEDLLAGRPGFEELKTRTFEICEFLTDVLGVERVDGAFPHRIGLHQSCHGLRELRLGSPSEIRGERQGDMRQGDGGKVRRLLASLDGVSFAELSRPDECCGFGGTFAVSEAAVSCMMGDDRLADHRAAGSEVLVAADMSCLMHLDGLQRRGRDALPVMHVAQVLAGEPVPLAAAR